MSFSFFFHGSTDRRSTPRAAFARDIHSRRPRRCWELPTGGGGRCEGVGEEMEEKEQGRVRELDKAFVLLQEITIQTDTRNNMSAEGEEELLDYSDSEEVNNQQQAEGRDAAVKSEETDKKGSYVGIHTTGFRDFLLKPELLRAIADCGFEHPSEG